MAARAGIDRLQYRQYAAVLADGQLSLDALTRIVKHDDAHGSRDAPALARKQVMEDARGGRLPVKKQLDEPGDQCYGVSWPLPLEFSRR